MLRDQCFLVMQYHHILNVFNKADTVLAVRIIIDQIPFGQLSKQLIQDLDGSIALNKGFVLALREIWLFKLSSSEHIKVYTFLFKINYLLHHLLQWSLQKQLTVSMHWLMKQEWIWNKAKLQRISSWKSSFFSISVISYRCYLSAEKAHCGETTYLLLNLAYW